MFWRSKRQQEAAGNPERAGDDGHASANLVPIRIFTTDEVIDGWTPLGEQRLSDLLNAEEALTFTRVPAAPAEDDWWLVNREHIVLVVAPPHTSARQLRVYRQRRLIRAETQHYEVQGVVHLIPGNRLDRTVIRTRQHFVPVTDAHVTSRASPDHEERHAVVLLNVVDPGDGLKLELVE